MFPSFKGFSLLYSRNSTFNLSLFYMLLLLSFLITYNTIYLFISQNLCLNIAMVLLQPILSSGLFFINLIIRSLAYSEIILCLQFIFMLFISDKFDGVTPLKGFCDVRISQNMRPRQYRSYDLLYPFFYTNSGGKYSQLPHNSQRVSFSYIERAYPKSHSFTQLLLSINTFSGFKSLQIYPFSCNLAIAKDNYIKYFFLLRSPIPCLLFIIRSNRLWGQYSIIKQTQQLSSNAKYRSGNNLDFTFERISSSFSMQFIYPCFLQWLLHIRFKQYCSLLVFCTTMNIYANVPSPIFPIIRNSSMLIFFSPIPRNPIPLSLNIILINV